MSPAQVSPQPDRASEDRQGLIDALERLKRHLRSHAANAAEEADSADFQVPPTARACPLDRLAELFGLTQFESQLLLLCAAIELDSDFAAFCAQPTFSFALGALPGAHWSALSPDRPLRRWRMIEIGPGTALTTSPLRIDERILNLLAGVDHSDERLAGIAEPVGWTVDLVPSHRKAARRIARMWAEAGPEATPAVQLCGPDTAIKRAIAHCAAGMIGGTLRIVSAHMLPSAAAELEKLIRTIERECLLTDGVILLECEGPEDPAREQTVMRFVETARVCLAVSAHQRRRGMLRPLFGIDIGKPAAQEQAEAWNAALSGHMGAGSPAIDNLVAHFSLHTHDIRNICREALSDVGAGGEEAETDGEALYNAVWHNCRTHARPRLEDLAQRIAADAAWEDLILPEAQRRVLKDIAVHVRERAVVYHKWGFGGENTRGLGISALFAGSSGTGKTMAAEALAKELRLDLYRIDLSSVVSKYIGETEKNLRRLFDSAEESGSVLLFDEADALFGKRSEVKDSHDRHANIEVSYLLQRVESYRGLAILTSNLPEAIDPAFLRRIRFIVQFRFPDAGMRAEIWRRVFPAATPVEGLDVQKLSRLNVAGGDIRNIAMHAAFAAADAGEPVRLEHVLRAARAEYEKLQRPLPESEIKGWV
jgi:hypothetical protein